jgi:ribosomal protein S5
MVSLVLKPAKRAIGITAGAFIAAVMFLLTHYWFID